MVLEYFKKNKFILIIVAICFFYLFPLYHSGFYISHDGQAQVVRIAAYYKAIIEGQIPPRWAADLNYGYGLPTLIFFFPLEGYLGALLHVLNFSFQDAFKILMGAGFICAPVFFFVWAKKIFNERAAFLGALIYGLAPYHFLDMYVRGQLAEILALAFVPVVFLYVENNLQKTSLNNILIGGVFSACLILSHSIVSFLFTLIIIFYIFVRGWPNKKNIILTCLIPVMGLLLSTFFWLPALYEGKYINSGTIFQDFYKNHFTGLGKLFFSNWGFGSNVNDKGGLSPQLGLLPVIVLILSSIFVAKYKFRRVYYFFILVLLISVFMSTPLSEFVWNNIHFLQAFQFPWRFTAVSSFAISIPAVFLFSKIKSNPLFALTVFFILILSTTFIKVAGPISKPDTFYEKYPSTAAYHSEATKVWTAGDAISYPAEPVEIISGNGNITNYVRRSTKHTFKVQTNSGVSIADNTVYFPGWQVVVDGIKTPIEFQDINYRGLITFSIPQGSHSVTAEFTESPVRLVADFISSFFLGAVGLLIILKLKFPKFINL